MIIRDMVGSIAVGSSNPAKVHAVEKAVKAYGKYEVISVNVGSGISAMPLSLDEVYQGAMNRAEKSQRGHWLGVGNEGGISFHRDKWYLVAATCVYDGHDMIFGGETKMPLPHEVVQKLDGGIRELGDVMDELVGDTEVKRKYGAIGVYTGQVLTRSQAFYTSAVQALSYWLGPYANNSENRGKA